MNSLIEKAYAATKATIDPITQGNAGGVSSVSDFIGIIAGWIVWIAGAAAFIYLVYSGILYISAAGNPDQAKKGQQGIINAVIGIVIVVLAATIISVVNKSASSGTI